jgi:hypothetical protein
MGGEMPIPFFTRKKKSDANTPKPQEPLTRWGRMHSHLSAGRLYPSERGPSMEVYHRMREDAQVAAGLAVIKEPVIAAGWSVTGESEVARRFVESMLRPFWRKLLRSLLTALDYGFSALELVYDLDSDGNLTITEVRDPDPLSIALNVDDDGSLTGFTQLPDTFVPGERAVIFTHRGEHGNHYGISRLRSAYAAWHAKKIMFLYTNRYFERRGVPITMIKYPPAPTAVTNGGVNTDTNSQKALDLGESLLANSVVAVPRVYDAQGREQWEIAFLEDAENGGNLIDYMNYLDKLILRALFVPERTITQDSATGSYAMAQAHQEVFLMALDGLIADVEECINAQIVEPLLRYNFGSGSRQPAVRLVMERLSSQRRQIVAEVAKQMLEQGKLQLDPDEVSKLLDIQLKEAPADTTESRETSDVLA